jgi:flagellar biosynthesis/type III secretory pathway M-ring protein FliF/YscJ
VSALGIEWFTGPPSIVLRTGWLRPAPKDGLMRFRHAGTGDLRPERAEPGPRKRGHMDTWLIIVIVVAAAVVVALLLWGVVRGRERRLEQRRDEASAHREQSELRARQAEEREVAAREELDRAERERAVAQGHATRADEIDPDVDIDRTERETRNTAESEGRL